LDLITILHAGVGSGTVLLIATFGELLAERSGVLNLGVEGMMLIGAMCSILATHLTGSPWIGVITAMTAAGLLSLVHGLISITFKSDQVVSGLAISLLGTGLSLIFGEGLSGIERNTLLPSFSIPGLSGLPILGSIFFENQGIIVYLGYLLVPLIWYYINRTRPGLTLRTIGEQPAAADALGVNVDQLRYYYVFCGGCLAGLSGATISLLVTPGWYSTNTTSGQGWIAIGMVIFAQWDPFRAAFGSYAFGALRRLILDIQGPKTLWFNLPNPVFYNPNLGYFMKMIPYAFTILVLVISSRESIRKRMGSPAALGLPYIRGER
jgi:simple sugar transport system permease protein